MRNFTELASARSDRPAPFADQLRLAVAAYLARFQGSSPHTGSGLRCSLFWCAERGPGPLTARRPHREPSIRWMQQIRPVKPSTVARRFSVTAGLYRSGVSDGALAHSPAEHLRRPAVPAESPAPGVHPRAVQGPCAPRPASPHPRRLHGHRHLTEPASPEAQARASRPALPMSVRTPTNAYTQVGIPIGLNTN
jgi:hypothetical protein